MALALFVSVLNNTMVNVAIPLIREDLSVPTGRTGWIITTYSLIFAVGIPLYGRTSDLFSSRRTFSLGLLVFAAGSLVCALSPSLVVLVIGRVLQGAGASAIPALAFGSVAKVLSAGRRGPAYGLLSSSMGVGAAAGPMLGGLLTSLVGWHSLFYGMLLLVLALLPGALYAIPETLSERQEDGSIHRLDLPGGVLLALTAGLLLFGITRGQTAGLASPLSWGFFLLAVLSAAVFSLRIRTVPEPFVSPRLFRSHFFLSAALVGFLAQFASLGSLFLAPLLLIEVGGLSALLAGLALAPGTVAVALLSPLAGRLSDQLGPRVVLFVGLSVMFISLLFISSYAAGASPYTVALGLFTFGVGYAGVNSPAANAASTTLSREAAGVGLGIYQLFFFLGSGTGPAVLGAFLASQQGGQAEALNPFYSLSAAPFSDAFLLAGAAVMLALFATLGIGRTDNGRKGKRGAG